MPTSISGTAGVTYPAGGLANTAGAGVGTTDSQTLTNKTLTSPTLTTPNIDSAQIPTVSGTAPLYMCRAWVNFNGNGPVIRGSGNVSSITVNATGNYTVTFTTALSNANYAYTIIGSNITNWGGINTINTDQAATSVPPTTTACRFQLLRYDTSASANPLYVNVIVVN